MSMTEETSSFQAVNPVKAFGVRIAQAVVGIALALMLLSGFIHVSSSTASASYELSTTCRLISGGLNYTYNRSIDAINNQDSKATDLWVSAHLRLSLLSDANGCNLDSDGSSLPTR
jgi:hypothetical protein